MTSAGPFSLYPLLGPVTSANPILIEEDAVEGVFFPYLIVVFLLEAGKLSSQLKFSHIHSSHPHLERTEGRLLSQE